MTAVVPAPVAEAYVAVMLAVPAEMPLTTPVFETVATAALLVAHVTSNVMVGGFLAGEAAENANDAMLADWIEKQFPTQKMVPTGKGAWGLVYFPCKAGCSPRAILVPARKIKSDVLVSVSVPLE